MEKTRPCLYFQQGRCHHKNDGDCDGSHQFCRNGNDCTFKGCKFLHPNDPGFDKTCKKSYFMCMHKDDCKFHQHPNRNYIYQNNKPEDGEYHPNDNNNANEKTRFRYNYLNKKNQEENKEHDEIIQKYRKYNHDADECDNKEKNENEIKDKILKIFMLHMEELKKYIDEKFNQLEEQLKNR